MTKEKILSTSSRLFYESGVANVRLQQIADNVKISVGNLAYHFPNKQAIVQSVYHTALTDLHQASAELFGEKGFSHFDDSLKAFFKFQVSNNFCINNTWEICRNYPQLHSAWKLCNKRLLARIQKSIAALAAEKLLIEEPFKSAYKILADHILLHLTCWMAQQNLKGKAASLSVFRRTTWALLFPYFTEQGRKMFAELQME